MPGRPKLKALAKRIDTVGGEDFVYEWIASGKTQKSLCEFLQCSKGLFYSWTRMAEDRREKLLHSRKIGAEVLAEESHDIIERYLEDPNLTSAQASLVRALANKKGWLAGKYDPENWGEKQVIDVNVTHAEIHIEALQEANKLKQAFLSENAGLLGSGEVVEGDYELEEENDGDND